MESVEVNEFKIGDRVVFTNPDKLKLNDEHPFDFGTIAYINNTKYLISVNDETSKYYGVKYQVNEDNVALAYPDDTLEDFEFVPDE